MRKYALFLVIFFILGCDGSDSNSGASISVIGTWTKSSNSCSESGIEFYPETIVFNEGNTGSNEFSDDDCSVTDSFSWSGDTDSLTISNLVRSCSTESCSFDYTDFNNNPQSLTCTSGPYTSVIDSGDPIDLDPGVGVTNIYFERVFTSSTYTIEGTIRNENVSGSPVVGECEIVLNRQ